MANSKTLHIILLVIAAAAVYSTSLGGEFVYDDKAMIVAYDLVKDIRNVPLAFVSSTSVYGNVNYYRPLQTITYMTDYFLWGDLPAGFHLTNVVMHVISVVLAYFFVNALFKNRPTAFVTALLFAVHPAGSSVVAYIAGRADAMLCVCMLACFLFYVRFRFYGRRKMFLMSSLAFFILALMSKEFAMMVPVAIFLFDRYGWKYTELKEAEDGRPDHVPFYVILAVYFLFRILRMGFFAEGTVPPFPFPNRLITAPYALVQYLRITIFPCDLHIGRVPWAAETVLDERVLASIFVAGAVFMAAYRHRFTEKRLWFGLMWFALMIFPSLNILAPLFYTLAENWLYIPSVGLFLVIGALANRTYRALAQTSFPAARYAVTAVLAAFVVTMGAITVRHNLTWKDEISLGMNTLKYNPREFKIYNNIGVTYLGKGQLDKAEDAFRKCLEIKPDTGMAYFNLYRVYMARGRRDEARQYLRKARELDPQRVNVLVEKMGIKD